VTKISFPHVVEVVHSNVCRINFLVLLPSTAPKNSFFLFEKKGKEKKFVAV
jgi:hypothetical protein